MGSIIKTLKSWKEKWEEIFAPKRLKWVLSGPFFAGVIALTVYVLQKKPLDWEAGWYTVCMGILILYVLTLRRDPRKETKYIKAFGILNILPAFLCLGAAIAEYDLPTFKMRCGFALLFGASSIFHIIHTLTSRCAQVGILIEAFVAVGGAVPLFDYYTGIHPFYLSTLVGASLLGFVLIILG